MGRRRAKAGDDSKPRYSYSRKNPWVHWRRKISNVDQQDVWADKLLDNPGFPAAATALFFGYILYEWLSEHGDWFITLMTGWFKIWSGVTDIAKEGAQNMIEVISGTHAAKAREHYERNPESYDRWREKERERNPIAAGVWDIYAGVSGISPLWQKK